MRIVKIKVSGKPTDLQRVESSGVLELQGCRILRLQGAKVQRLQGSRKSRLQVPMVSRLQDFSFPGVTGFQNRNPLLEPSQEFLAGSLAGTCPDAVTKLADLV